jgi:large subunit ribosomal protein L21
MYAVIRTGGKQYRVSPGDIISVEKLPGNIGDTVSIDDVLMIGSEKETKIGTPALKDASVTGVITDQTKGKKITVFKFKRRKGYRKKQGHRQRYTRIRIDKIKS